MGFVGLHTALSGIRAAQTGLDITSHNVANAHTDGYTRQRVDQATRRPYVSLNGLVGTGVDVAGISRARDAFLDARARTVGAEFSWHDTTAGLLGRTESVLGEPDNGLTAQLGALWDAFDDLALDPGQTASRQQVLSSLDALAGRVRGVATGWDQLATDTAAQLDGAVGEASDLLARVADLNRQIGDLSLRDDSPNDLLDQRDLALDRVSALLGATISTGSDGMVSLHLPAADGTSVALVTGTTAVQLSVEAGAVQATGADGVPVEVVARAEVGALHDFLGTTLPERFAALDTFVGELAAALNAQHGAGTDADGNPGGDLLTFDPAAGAARSIRVPPALLGDPRLLAAGGPAPSGVHDARNAEALAALRTAEVGGEPPFDSRLRAFVVDLGARVATARGAADAQGSLAVSATVARQGAHGVSIDEEMVSLVAYQRALEAASRVMTAVDQALDVLVNRTGIVGR